MTSCSTSPLHRLHRASSCTLSCSSQQGGINSQPPPPFHSSSTRSFAQNPSSPLPKTAGSLPGVAPLGQPSRIPTHPPTTPCGTARNSAAFRQPQAPGHPLLQLLHPSPTAPMRGSTPQLPGPHRRLHIPQRRQPAPLHLLAMPELQPTAPTSPRIVPRPIGHRPRT